MSSEEAMCTMLCTAWFHSHAILIQSRTNVINVNSCHELVVGRTVVVMVRHRADDYHGTLGSVLLGSVGDSGKQASEGTY